MASSSYAHVLCTTSSATSAIGTSAAYIFDSDHGSVAFSSDTSDDIVWNESGGTITFKKAGIYHVAVTAITSQVTAPRVQTTTMNLNAASNIYSGGVYVNQNQDPIESTHQRIFSISAGDVLHIKVVTAGNTMGIEKGSALSIMEVTSGVYASSTVSAAGTNNTTDEFNPYDTDGDGPVFASAGKIASGVTFTPDAGSWTVPSDGKYFIMVTNVQQAAATTNSNITMKLKEGSNVLWTGACRNNNNTDPVESTICVIEDLDADEVLTVTWDIASGQCQAGPGSTFTVYKLSDTWTSAHELGWAKHISVVNKAALTATAAEVNPFDEDSYSSADFDTRASLGITFTSSTGRFTVLEAGRYLVIHNAIITVASDAVVTMKVKVNGVAQITADSIKVDSFPDPINRTIQGILNLDAGDVVAVTIDSDSPNIGHDPGSSITILRVPQHRYKESTPVDLIDDDFTINSFSQDNLSVQHARNTNQVPFILGARSPSILRLRGTTRLSPAVKTGDKKN